MGTWQKTYPRQRECLGCGAQFEASHYRNVHCGIRCRFRSLHDEPRGDSCTEWRGAKGRMGYGMFTVHPQGTRTRGVQAHRVSWSLHNGKDIPPGLVVMHSCDNPSCVNPTHLSLGTTADNMHDRDTKGRRHDSKGESNGAAKLTMAQVNEMRRRREAGEELLPLSRAYGVAKSTVCRICRMQAWS